MATPNVVADGSIKSASEPKKTNKVILVGIGGATCSGKTTLAKLLNRIIPNSIIIHQDDFAPPQEQIPIHPVHKVQDWDSASGAVDWPRLVAFVKNVKETGILPGDHQSHEWLNEQSQREFEERQRAAQGEDQKEKEKQAVEGVVRKWQQVFEDVASKQDEETHIVWGLLDGFLLYWNQQVIDELDVRIFLRVPHDTLKQRRHERHGYHTADGSLWKDPPGYWEQIVYPAYVEAHRGLFQDGDVEHGKPKSKSDPRVDGLILIEGTEVSMSEILDRCCQVLVNVRK